MKADFARFPQLLFHAFFLALHEIVYGLRRGIRFGRLRLLFHGTVADLRESESVHDDHAEEKENCAVDETLRLYREKSHAAIIAERYCHKLQKLGIFSRLLGETYPYGTGRKGIDGGGSGGIR